MDTGIQHLLKTICTKGIYSTTGQCVPNVYSSNQEKKHCLVSILLLGWCILNWWPVVCFRGETRKRSSGEVNDWKIFQHMRRLAHITCPGQSTAAGTEGSQHNWELLYHLLSLSSCISAPFLAIRGQCPKIYWEHQRVAWINIPHFAQNFPLSLSYWGQNLPLWHPSKILILGLCQRSGRQFPKICWFGWEMTLNGGYFFTLISYFEGEFLPLWPWTEKLQMFHLRFLKTC